MLNSNILADFSHAEGRIGSALDEDTIIVPLLNYFKDRAYVPNKRSWYDILIDNTPFNIKSTMGSRPDNAGNYRMLRWVFTGDKSLLEKHSANKSIDLMELLDNQYETYKINKEIPDPKVDYGFIVLNKLTNDTHLISLLELSSISKNSANLPFQVVWDRNHTPTDRTITEAFKFLVLEPLDCIKTSFHVKVYKALYE